MPTSNRPHQIVAVLALSSLALLLTGGTAAGDDRNHVIDFDVETTDVARSSRPAGFVELDGAVYFTAYSTARGGGLYRIDLAQPASSPPTLVRAFSSGVAQGLVAGDGRLLLVAGDRDTGSELWTSDGTTAGTHLVKDIYPGPRGGVITSQVEDPLFPLVDRVVFTATSPSKGTQLWSSDGTEVGTVEVSAFSGGSGGVQYSSRGVEFGGQMYIGLDDGSTGSELWRTDGTAGSATKVIDLRSPGNPSVSWVTPASGRVFFAADDGNTGYDLHVTDGTAGNTLPIDLYPGGTGSQPYSPRALNGGLILHANLPATGRSIVFLDVPGDPGQLPTIGAVIDMNPGGSGSSDEDLGVMGGRLYFVHTGAGLTPGVWATDGTVAGTVLIASISADLRIDRGFPVAAASGNLLYYLLRNDTTGRRSLHVTDGVAAPLSTVMAFDATADGDLDHLVRAAGGRVYLSIATGTLGQEPWQTDGTPAGTTLVANIEPDKGGTDTWRLHVLGNGRLLFGSLESASRNLFRVESTIGVPAQIPVEFELFSNPVVRGSTLFGALNDPSAGSEPGATDGTAAGTSVLADLEPGPDGSWPQDIVDVGGDLYFTAYTQALGNELYRLPAGAAAPVLLADLNTAPGESSYPYELTAVGSRFYFAADSGNGHELFVSDGTALGTALVAPGAQFESPEPFAALGDRLVFLAGTAAAGYEPYVTDGTPGGTQLLRDIRPGDLDSEVYEVSGEPRSGVLGGRLYFAADDGLSGRELWRTDGTPGGTERLADLFAGAAGSDPTGFSPLGDKLVFTADSPGIGRELWTTDGTLPGTQPLIDLNPGPASSFPDNFLVLPEAGLMFFAATTTTTATAADTGRELYVTDGTARGTRLVADVLFGPGNSSPRALARHGDQLSFIAYDEQRGNELRRFPLYRVGAAANVDSDHDLWPDVIEDAFLTATYDATDRPGGADLLTGRTLVKPKLTVALRFDRGNRDKLILKGKVMVPPGLDLSTQRIAVNVGGIVRGFPLDAKGKAKNLFGDKFALRAKLKKGLTRGGESSFTLKITDSSLAEYLADEGLTATPDTGADLTAGAAKPKPFLTDIVVSVYWQGAVDSARQAVKYKVKKEKKGLAR